MHLHDVLMGNSQGTKLVFTSDMIKARYNASGRRVSSIFSEMRNHLVSTFMIEIRDYPIYRTGNGFWDLENLTLNSHTRTSPGILRDSVINCPSITQLYHHRSYSPGKISHLEENHYTKEAHLQTIGKRCGTEWRGGTI